VLNFLPGFDRNCEATTRRSFLQVGSLGALGLSLPTLLAAKRASAGNAASDVNCILVWTRGGTSHHDTFDPKPDAPAAVRGEYGVIDTSIPGVQFTEIVPNMARSLDRSALLRG
jgi:hypothetical protein